MSSRLAACCMLAVAVSGLVGCSEAESTFTEVKRVDERLTRDELAVFLRIVESLPNGRFPDAPVTFGPLPEWGSHRTLPVGELVEEERRSLADRWDFEARTRRLRAGRRFERALKQELLTAEQFVAIGLAIGAALSRGELRDDQDLQEVLERAEPRIAVIEKDRRTFASLTPAEQFRLQQEAGWLVRADRAERLLSVPVENVELVRKHVDELKAVMPGEFQENPLDDIVDPLVEYGIPFTDDDPDRADEDIDWSPAEAIVGLDAPDGGLDAGDADTRRELTRRDPGRSRE